MLFTHMCICGFSKGDMSKAVADAIDLWIKIPSEGGIEFLSKLLKMSPKEREKLLKSMK